MSASASPEASPLLAIVGPTAVGKSALAARLARTFGGEVVNADSRQVYEGMPIGTAAPTAAERAGVPHHLYEIVPPDAGFSLARFLALATEAIQGIHERGRLAVLVGGTGQYVWGLLEGWKTPEVPPDAAARASLLAEAEAAGTEALHTRLGAVDPVAAGRIDPRNVRRTVRALEVYQATGVPFSEAQRREPPPYETRILGLTTRTRAALHARIDRRVEAMLAAGWLDEVRDLLAKGLSADLAAFSSMGYREMARHLQGELDLEEAVRRVNVAHHRLARRQATWFKRGDPRIRWSVADVGADAEAETIVARLLDAGA